MQDILLRATQEAQSIIMDCLNGYNFGQTYLTLRTHLQRIRDKKDTLYGIKVDAMQVKIHLVPYNQEKLCSNVG